MLEKLTLLFLLLLCSFDIRAQNFVPNGGFEYYTAIPITLGDFYVTDWKSCGWNITPDFYSEMAQKTDHAYPSSDYCKVKPAGGVCFAGIILEEDDHSYREPITSRLVTTLRADSTYSLKIAVAIPYISCYRMESFEIIFTETAVSDCSTLKPEDYETSFTVPLDSVKDDFSWYTYSFEFEGSGNERYISIGNFKSAKDSKLTKLENRIDDSFKELYDQAYICIDNIELYDVALMEQEQTEAETISAESPLEPLVLKNLQFEFASSILQTEEIPELDKVVEFLLTNTEVMIHITGHTDNTGNPEDNLVLSLDRANSVAGYLIIAGIDETRITTEGLGSEEPLSTNETEEGRAQNRRVVIAFISE